MRNFIISGAAFGAAMIVAKGEFDIRIIATFAVIGAVAGAIGGAIRSASEKQRSPRP